MCSYTVCVCVCSDGVAVQRGAWFGPRGLSPTRSDRLSEIQWRGSSASSCRQNRRLWAVLWGKTKSWRWASGVFLSHDYDSLGFFPLGQSLCGWRGSAASVSARAPRIMGGNQFPAGAPSGQWDVCPTGRGGASKEDASLPQTDLWPLRKAQQQPAE